MDPKFPSACRVLAPIVDTQEGPLVESLGAVVHLASGQQRGQGPARRLQRQHYISTNISLREGWRVGGGVAQSAVPNPFEIPSTTNPEI